MQQMPESSEFYLFENASYQKQSFRNNRKLEVAAADATKHVVVF
jgi:hypothetical protein